MASGEKRKSEFGPGIEAKRNDSGKIVAFKLRCCVGREQGRQVWRTTTVSADDSRIEGLTPKKLKDELASIKHEWVKQAKDEYQKEKEAQGKAKPTKDEKNRITYGEFVQRHWMPVHVKNGKHSPNSIAFFEATVKSSVDFFGKEKLADIQFEDIKLYLKYLNTEARTETTEEKDVPFTATMTRDGKAALSWNSRKNALSYKVYRKGKRAKAFTRIGGTTELSYTDDEIKPGAEYAVKAVVPGSGEPYNETTKMHHFSTFRNVMNFAYRMEYIQENPCKKIEKNEAPKRSKNVIDFLSPGEAQEFIAAVDREYAEAVRKFEEAGERAREEALRKGEDPSKVENPEIGTLCRAAMWRCYMYILITTGLRRAEAVGLRWGDINHDKKTLTVKQNVVIDKSSKTKQIVKTTKTEDIRFVALLTPVYEMLIEYSGLMTSAYKSKVSPKWYIFCSEADPMQPIYVTTPTRHVRRFVKRNNLPDVSPHDLRHTAASLALESGAGMKEISDLMGHADIGTTAKFYAALTQEAKRRTIEGIGSILFGE